MSKRKKKPNQSSYSEWLQSSRRISDGNIVRILISESSEWKIETQKLDRVLFEKTYGLGGVPKNAVLTDNLERILGYEQEFIGSSIPMSKREPSGDELASQIESLLPNNVSETESESIVYALCRIVTDRLPKDKRWSIVPVGLDALSASLVNLHIISKAVNQRIPWMTAIWESKIKEAKIAALESIMETLLKNPSKSDIREALRIADGNFKEAICWDQDIDNQDPFSQQITGWISIQTITDLRKKVITTLGDIKGHSTSRKEYADVQNDPLTNWNILALRSDGPAAYAHETLLRLLRTKINILRYDPVRNLLIKLAHSETPGHPSVADLKEVTDILERNAYYRMHQIQPLFTECYIPNLGKIGLRYRYIFTPIQRSGVHSKGQIERLEFIEEEVRGCMISVEPNWSEGPRTSKYDEDFYEAVVEDEIVTLNLNHFNLKTGEWYSLKQGDSSDTSQDDSLLIQRSSQSTDRKPFSLSPWQAKLLGFLWILQGPRNQRKWFLDSINHRLQTGNRNLGILLKNQVVKLLYLPALEFCQLPDGLIAYANCNDRKSRDRFVTHIIESQPFSRILFGDSNDVVAHIRNPYKTSAVAGELKDKMKEFSDHCFAARLSKRTTFKIPIFHSLLQPKSGTWIDPWKNSN